MSSSVSKALWGDSDQQSPAFKLDPFRTDVAMEKAAKVGIIKDSSQILQKLAENVLQLNVCNLTKSYMRIYSLVL